MDFHSTFFSTRSLLEHNTIQGDSPVEEEKKVFESILSTVP